MSTITLPNIRVGSDLQVRARLKDGGVAIDWSTLSNIKACIYSDAQRALAGRCAFSIDEEDSTLLVCTYAANKPQYLGVNRIVISAKYMGETKTYDKPAFSFVRWTADQEGEEITIDDPDVDVEIEVEDISSSILQEAVDAAFTAADRANDAAAAAEHMVDIHTGPEGKSAYEVAVEEGYTGTEEEWLASLKGDTGETPDISIGTVTTVAPGTPASASMTGTPEEPVLNLSIPQGVVGATPNFTVGTVTTGEPGSSVIVTITGTPEAPVLNLTIPQGMQGNTGSSVEYPYELVNNLTTNDATKGLTAAMGVQLESEVSQLEAKVDDLSTGKYYGYFATSADLPDDATVDGFAYVGEGPTYTIYNLRGGVWTSSGITVNQSPIGNEEDIDQNSDGKLQFANRVYNAQQPNGMGYKILRKDATFASQVTETNTIYEIRYGFSLGGVSVNIPANCILTFNGGKLENGNLHGAYTIISAGANKIFDNITFSGAFLPGKIFPQWFGAEATVGFDNTQAFQKAFDSIGTLGNEVYIPNGEYNFNGELRYAKKYAVICGGNNTKLNYYGTSNFITIGDKTNSIMADTSEFRSFFIRAYDANSGDIFRIEHASKLTFRDLEITYGENAFNTAHNNFKGFFYGYFYNVTAGWQKKNGFNIIPYGTAQVNDVHFFECRGSSAGNPTVGTHTNIPDNVNGNGFYVGGTAITILNCAAELNNGYGIKVDNNISLTGAVFEGCYFETNLMGNHIFVGNVGYKGSIRIGANFFNPGKYPIIELRKSIRKSRQIENLYEDNGVFDEKKSIVSLGEKYYDLHGHFCGLKIPASVKFRVKAGNGGTYCQICPGILFGGDILRLVGASGVEAHTITDITNGVVTLDSATGANYQYVMVISEEHPLYVIPKTDLTTIPIPAETLSGKYPGARGYYLSTSQGATTFTIPSGMASNNPSMKVGDVVYLYSGNYVMRFVGLTTYTDQQATLSIPSALQGSKLEKHYCALFLSDLADTSIPFDYFYGYSD